MKRLDPGKTYYHIDTSEGRAIVRSDLERTGATLASNRAADGNYFYSRSDAREIAEHINILFRDRACEGFSREFVEMLP
jgi:hypothetical protein